MKTLKIVFAAVAVLFLSLSLSGCFDEEGSSELASSGVTGFVGSNDIIRIPKYNTEKEITVDMTGKFNDNDADLRSFVSSIESHSTKNFRVYVVPNKMVLISFFSQGGFSVEMPKTLKDRSDNYSVQVSQGINKLFSAEWKLGDENIVISRD